MGDPRRPRGLLDTSVIIDLEHLDPEQLPIESAVSAITMAELAVLRDTQYPYVIPRLKRIEVLLKNWSDRSEENARRARDELFGFQNSRDGFNSIEDRHCHRFTLRMDFAFAAAAGSKQHPCRGEKRPPPV